MIARPLPGSIPDDLLAPPGRARAMSRVEDLFGATGGMLRARGSRGALSSGTVEVRKEVTTIGSVPPRGDGISTPPLGDFFPVMSGLPESFPGLAMAGDRAVVPSEEVRFPRGPALEIRPAALETPRVQLRSTFPRQGAAEGTRTAEIPIPGDSRAGRLGRREGPEAYSESSTGVRGR